MGNISDFISELKLTLSDSSLITDPSTLARYETTNFKTTQKIPCVIIPNNIDELKLTIKLANKHTVSIYPTSRGRNWGLGSRVPVLSNNCVVDLKNMNSILDYDEDNAFITVEPGVSYKQASEFLKDHKSKFYLPSIGGPSDASLIANALERGDAAGPLGDRAVYCCGMEVMLPNSNIINTGLGIFHNSSASKFSKFGLGPSIDGLFFQSNFGIVTKMTFWLTRRLPYFHCVIFTVTDEKKLIAISKLMRELQEMGVLPNTSYVLWNIYRFITAQMQYPWNEKGEPESNPQDLLKTLPPVLRDARWFGIIGVSSPTRKHASANKALLKKALKGYTSKLIILDSAKAWFLKKMHKPLSKFTNINYLPLLNSLYYESVFRGYPTKVETSSVYWRKRSHVTNNKNSNLDPDRDRCGIYWVCISLPFDGKHISNVTNIVERISFEFGFEPQVMFLNMSAWFIKSFIILIFDRDVEEEEIQAYHCYKKLFKTLQDSGYSSHRLGIQSMSEVVVDDLEYVQFLKSIKQTIDPNDVLAPGRYDFRHLWK